MLLALFYTLFGLLALNFVIFIHEMGEKPKGNLSKQYSGLVVNIMIVELLTSREEMHPVIRGSA